MKREPLIPEGLVGKELHDWLVANKSLLINAKKSEVKEADAIGAMRLYATPEGNIIKMEAGVNKAAFKEDTDDLIERTSIINTTYWYDSHGDVHIDGLWKKSLSESRELYLCEEHKLNFRGIISDNVKAFTKIMAWKDLGLDIPGNTQALVFVSQIEKARNEYMFEQYKKMRVKNHSVGMRYVQIYLAVNNEDYKDEFAIWNKYIDKIANRAEVEASGYFFAVTEAKVIEGSAVVRGSNIMTPTMPKESNSTDKGQPSDDTGEGQPQPFDVTKAIQGISLKQFMA